MVNMVTPGYPIINGGLMQSYVGQQASLLGHFESIDNSGRMMKLKLTDGNMIIAVLTTAVSGPISPGSCVFMHGVVENRNKFKPSGIRIIKPEVCEKFDDELWNEMTAILVENPDLMYQFDDMNEHFGVADVSADGGNADIIPFPDHNVAEDAGKAAGESFDQSFDDNF